MNILVIPKESISGVLLATPVIRSLKVELQANVHILLDANQKDVLLENPYVAGIYDYDQSFLRIRRELDTPHLDLIIDLRNSWKSKFIGFGRTKSIRFKENFLKKWLYTKFRINLLPNKHIIEKYFEFLQPLKIKSDHLGIDFFIPEKDLVENDWLPKSHQNGYAAIALSSKYNTRKLPVNRLIELCDRINKPIILIGTKDDLTIADEVEAFFRHGTQEQEEVIEDLNKKTIIFNACGKFSFNQLASLMKNASWVFSYDNDMLHVAAAFKKKIFSVWGNTTPNFGLYPYETKFTVFENNKLNCRPCSSKGFANCPKGHFKCMNDITFDFYLPD